MAQAAKLAAAVGAVSAEWNGFAVLHTAAARVGALDLGFVPADARRTAADIAASAQVLFLLGADEVDLSNKAGFTVYIGSHGDNGAHGADVILPGAAYTEKSGTWVNTEGRVQMGNRAGFAPGDAREDWRSCARSPTCWASVCPSTRWPNCAAGSMPTTRISPRSMRSLGRTGRNRRACTKSRCDGEIGVCVAGERLLFDEPDRACVGRHG